VKGVRDRLSGKASRDAVFCGPPVLPEDEGYEDSLIKGNFAPRHPNGNKHRLPSMEVCHHFTLRRLKLKKSPLPESSF